MKGGSNKGNRSSSAPILCPTGEEKGFAPKRAAILDLIH